MRNPPRGGLALRESGGGGNRTRVRKTFREWLYARIPECVRDDPAPGLPAITFSPFDLDLTEAVRFLVRSSRS